MDPTGSVLRTWVADGSPCSSAAFEGVACNEWGKVANVSLHSKGLSGVLSTAVAKLRCLNGFYFSYRKLSGEIPKGISNLTELVDLYINVNMLNDTIPPELGSMSSLQGRKCSHFRSFFLHFCFCVESRSRTCSELLDLVAARSPFVFSAQSFLKDYCSRLERLIGTSIYTEKADTRRLHAEDKGEEEELFS